MIKTLVLTSVYIIKQSERNNHPSLFRPWCSSGTWFKEWETHLLEGGGYMNARVCVHEGRIKIILKSLKI